MKADLPLIVETKRLASPATTPQALAWHAGRLWMGSRDLRRIYAIDMERWTVIKEDSCPGIPWAAVSAGENLRFTIGEDPEDDRYIRTYNSKSGFTAERIACPDLTGSYLGFDGNNLYLSQWYEHRILKFDAFGSVARSFNLAEEICGHTYANGFVYVLRGTEQGNEDWRIARFDPTREKAGVTDLARVPFACRSLTFDGERFWSNHRAANEIVSFVLPKQAGTST